MESSRVGTKKIRSDGLSMAQAYRPSGVAKQWMNYLTNLTYAYNPSTTP